MTEPIRSERRFGITGQLEPVQRQHLFALRNSEVWPDILDVLEMICIETETTLINTDAAQPAEVLVRHQSAQNMWRMFTHLQLKIDEQIAIFLSSVDRKPIMPELTPREKMVENILDPTKYPDFADGNYAEELGQ
jgi:hypothetical protein